MSANSIRLFPILTTVGVALALSTAVASAEEDITDPVPPDMVEETSGERSEREQAENDSASSEAPVVQTRMEHGQRITEYRRQGQVYMMTVKPRNGPKQYWKDAEGDGQFQNRTSPDIDETVNLPKWRLGGW